MKHKIIDYNRKTLLEALSKEFKTEIKSVTFNTWVKRSLIAPSSYINRGTRLLPVYYRSSFPEIVAKLKWLNEKGLIRIRLNEKKKNKQS